jgi:hypothetical protein
MADFRKKLFGLAVSVTMFTGISYGQLCGTATGGSSSTLNPPTSGAAFIRAEGQAELLPPLTFSCTSATPTSGQATLSIYLSPALTITSPILSTSGATNGQTEIVLTSPQVTGNVYGTVIGSSVTFSSFTFAAAATTTFTISNIRVNASALPGQVAGALPTGIAAQAFISGPITNLGTGTTQQVSPGTTNSATVAYAVSGFGANTGKVYVDAGNVKTGTIISSPYPVCSSSLNSFSTSTAPSASFYVAVNEGFSGAFKTLAHEASTVPVAAGAISASSISNAVNSGTRIKLVFSNIAPGVNIFTAQTVNTTTIGSTATSVGDSAVLSLVPTETQASPGAFPATTAATGFIGTPLVAATVSGTTATAIYEVSTDNLNSIDNFSIPVYFQVPSNTIAPTSTAVTVTTSLAPQPATAASIIPSFSSTAPSIVTTNTVSFSACSTTLLFPFVTNANGFETGIAIANTSKDPFGGKLGGATAQSGTCSLNFYQSGVSGATNPTSVTAPNLTEGANQPYLAGEDYAFTLTQALAVNTSNPATFQGYVIAQCNFTYAHAFAYILGGLQPGMFVNPNNTAMGYLAIVINRGSVSGISDFGGQ